MLLSSDDGARLELRVRRYQFPVLDPRDLECDADWVVLEGSARPAHGRGWSFADPVLTSTEVTDLVSWLRRAAEAAVTPSSVPAVDGDDDEVAWWELLEEAGWLLFTEPWLTLAVEQYVAGGARVVVGLGRGLAPSTRSTRAQQWRSLPLVVALGDLRSAAAALEADLLALPTR